jgi:hypothetical protein
MFQMEFPVSFGWTSGKVRFYSKRERASRSFGQHREPRARPPGFEPGAQRISAQNEWEWGNSPVQNKKNKVLQQTFPELASYSRNINISVHEMKSTMPLITHFHLPLSTEAYDQSVQLNTIIQNLHFNLSLINGVIYGVQPFSLHRKHTRT